MAFLSLPTKKRSRDQAFNLAETMIAAGAVVFLTSVSLRPMLHFNEQRKLRSAAVELSGYLQVARSVANAENAPCSIALTQEDGGVFVPDPAAASNSCRAGTIATSLRLGSAVGSRSLRAEVIPSSGSFPLTFNPEGTIRNGATVLITSPMTPLGGWCVDVQAPLATVRMGWRATGSASCNYLAER